MLAETCLRCSISAISWSSSASMRTRPSSTEVMSAARVLVMMAPGRCGGCRSNKKRPGHPGRSVEAAQRSVHQDPARVPAKYARSAIIEGSLLHRGVRRPANRPIRETEGDKVVLAHAFGARYEL